MTYPPQPGGYGPYGQQHGYGQQPSGPPYQEPMTSVPSSPAAGYPQPGYAQPAYGGMPTPPPEPGERPQRVTAGAMSMVGLAVLALFNALMGVIFNNQITSNYAEWCEDLYSGSSYDYSSSCESSSPGTVGFQMFSSIFGFLWVLAFVGAALFVLRGFNWARIGSFVVNGIFIAWQFFVMICAGLMTAVMESAASRMDSSGLSSGTSIDDIIPGWYFPTVLIVSLISIAVSAFSLVFLANRQASAWFRANTLARAAGVI